MHAFVPLTPTTFLERSGNIFPTREAVNVGEKPVTFASLLSRTRRCADALKALGVEYGDRVGLLSENRLETIEAHFAIPALGAVIVSLNPWLPSRDIAAQLAFCEAECLIVSEDFLKLHKDMFLEKTVLKHVLVIGSTPDEPYAGPPVLRYADAVDAASQDTPLDSAIRSELDPIAINFTSGTTGFPKGVVISHRAAYLHALGQVLMLDLTRDSRYLWTLPMFHVNGWGHMWAGVAIGARQILIPGDTQGESDFVHFIEQHDATHLAGAPRLVRALVEATGTQSTLRGLTIVTGGAAPSPLLINQLEDMGVRLIHQYGLNETCGPYVVCEEQDGWPGLERDERTHRRMRQGVATLHAGTGLRVVDEDMRDVPADGSTLGEVIMAGNTVATGYHNNPEATQKSFVDGWFRSGDMAVVHEDGYLEIKDRIKDLIYVETDYGWENISSIEVENTINRHPEVRDVAVVGLNDEDNGGGTRLVAFLERSPESHVDAIQLRQYCEETLAAYKRPQHFIFAELPKTATGKVRKDLLVKEAANRLQGTEEVSPGVDTGAQAGKDSGTGVPT